MNGHDPVREVLLNMLTLEESAIKTNILQGIAVISMRSHLDAMRTVIENLGPAAKDLLAKQIPIEEEKHKEEIATLDKVLRTSLATLKASRTKLVQ